MHLHVYTRFNEDRKVEIYKYVRVNFEHDELIDYMRITLFKDIQRQSLEH